MSHPPRTIGPMDVRFNEAKFTELVVLVAERLRADRAGGATKLNKVLFFVEFTHLRRHQVLITGCTFQKLAHGPAPRQLLPVRTRLIELGEAELITEDFLGRPQQRLVPRRPARLDMFDDHELTTVDDVLEQLQGMTGLQVSELSHEEPGWRLTDLSETIPFSAAFLDLPQVSTPVSRDLARSVAERYGFDIAS
jgi:hypothetical protein